MSLYCSHEATNVVRDVIDGQGSTAQILGSEAVFVLKTLVLQQRQSNHAEVTWESHSSNPGITW